MTNENKVPVPFEPFTIRMQEVQAEECWQTVQFSEHNEKSVNTLQIELNTKKIKLQPRPTAENQTSLLFKTHIKPQITLHYVTSIYVTPKCATFNCQACRLKVILGQLWLQYQEIKRCWQRYNDWQRYDDKTKIKFQYHFNSLLTIWFA